MKFFIVAFFSLLFFICNAQTAATLFAASKNGLSLREQPGTDSRVLQKIAYGQKVLLEAGTLAQLNISTEGFKGVWQKVKYNNQVGYVVSTYLLPAAPPKPGIKKMKDYLAQISVVAGSPVSVKNKRIENTGDEGSELKKQLYKNGAEWHGFYAYEYNSDTYFIPDFSIEQAFLLVRLIGEYATEVGARDSFPDKNSEAPLLNMGTRKITVENVKLADGKEGPVNKIKIETDEGPVSTLEIFLLDGQAVISWSSGV